jgi:UDP-N-acetylglucosamine diphosphorylase/glucosamine-1-phosphate N-acetyltransferase
MRICVFEDAGVARLGPLTLTRPAFDLRCGARTLLERQLRLFRGVPCALVRPELAELCRLAHPELHLNDPTWPSNGSAGPVVLINARWLAPPTLSASETRSAGAEIGLVGEQVAYAIVPAGLAADAALPNLGWRLAEWKQELPRRQAGGAMLDYPWDLVERNVAALEEDYALDWAQRERVRMEGVSLLGPPERFVAHPEAHVEPLVLADTRNGPVLVDRAAVVQAGSRLEGPCYIGPHTHILAGRVRESSIGPQCRIGGEVEASIVQGFSNKAHDGFLGHSYLGEWVNFGAGTHTSDLRNDYGEVRVPLGGQLVATRLLKVGSFVGDHTKTCIGTLLNTGSAIGPFGQLVTPGTLLPRLLPAFCQVVRGHVSERTDLKQMFATAATAMGRRGRAWTETDAEFFLGLYERTAGERRQLIRDGEQRRLRQVV